MGGFAKGAGTACQRSSAVIRRAADASRSAEATGATDAFLLDRFRVPKRRHGGIALARNPRNLRAVSDGVRELRLFFLGGVCCAPERAWVDAIGIDFQHCVVELARGRCCSI